MVVVILDGVAVVIPASIRAIVIGLACVPVLVLLLEPLSMARGLHAYMQA